MAPIRFDGGYLSAPEDVRTLMRGVQLARRILRAPAMQRVVSAEIEPAAAEAIDEAALEAYVRTRAKTVYHRRERAGWAPMHWPSSTRNCACTAWADCASPTLR